MKFEELAGRKVTVWGAGREGRAAHAELARRGFASTIAVTGENEAPDDLLEAVVSGEAASALLAESDAIVVSPGIPHTDPEYLKLKESGVVLTSLMDLWLNEHHESVIAVTGTKGKSTTASLIAHILNTLDIPASLVGNLGIPVTEFSGADGHVAVTEVSSYQAANVTVSPRVVAVTCLYPEHLTWHGSFERYVRDKLNLVAHFPETVVSPDDDPELASRLEELISGSVRFSQPDDINITVSDKGVSWGMTKLPAADIPLKGRHNLHNVALALAAVDSYFDLDAAQKTAALSAVSTFKPLAHRLETIPTRDGRTWVDDSLATAPEAVVAALGTFADSPVTLIAGGADRGVPFDPLIDYLRGRKESKRVEIVAVGPAGARLVEELGGTRVKARTVDNFAAALVYAGEYSDAPVVLLSPGAPSFDEFTSYEERSAAFRAYAESREVPA